MRNDTEARSACAEYLVRVRAKPVHQVARLMGRSPDAITNLLARAQRKLLEEFGETESFHLPDTLREIDFER